MDSYRGNLLETINEATVLCVIYLLMCFTEFVPSANMRYELGPIYIALSGGNFILHLVLIIIMILNKARIKIMRMCIVCIAKRRMRNAKRLKYL